jgi:hypothetical protein
VILSAYVGVMVLVAAASLGGLERCLGPDMRRFPCVNDRTLWVLRIYTLTLAWAAFDRLNSLHTIDPIDATAGQAVASTAMAFAHGSLLVVVLKLRLNEGVWPRLFARWRRAHELNKIGGQAGAVLARAAAGGEMVHTRPPVSDEVLQQLANRP